jgi:hypothetical protein
MIKHETMTKVVIPAWKEGGKKWRIVVTLDDELGPCLRLEVYTQDFDDRGPYLVWKTYDKECILIDQNEVYPTLLAIAKLRNLVTEWSNEEQRRKSILQKVCDIWRRSV